MKNGKAHLIALILLPLLFVKSLAIFLATGATHQAVTAGIWLAFAIWNLIVMWRKSC